MNFMYLFVETNSSRLQKTDIIHR